MIRKLTEKDNDKLMKLIMVEPEINLYIIGDVENYGYDKKFLEYFGEFDKDNTLVAVMIRYFSVFSMYAEEDFDIAAFADLINSFEDFGTLVGKTEVISKLEGTALGLNKGDHHHFAVLKEINPLFEADEKIKVHRADIEDIKFIAELKHGITEFSTGVRNFEEILEHNFKTGTSHGYYVKLDGKLVSYIQTSAENSMSAMVENVMTDKEYRKRGLASACLKAVCEDLIRQKKTPCLFYKNPEAGAIYKRIGFIDIGHWSMYKRG